MTSMTAEQEIEQKALDRAANATMQAAAQQVQADLQVAAAAEALKNHKINQKATSVQIARDMLINNAASKPVDERQTSAADIVAYANTLYTYVLGDDA
jgi:cell envelope opacity-associated protein A